ncbi:hypothetical protein FOL47_000458 [Perkinsus chesapeaki]|uniref:Uncharacterized protein n=1 Tax=Perkinsus chesapeaki TaxID=330153 RepID=A0A7J6KVK6_PERCH|nr:hypothetical protein FOL47_000458 [Perkinsus chesapeaki]
MSRFLLTTVLVSAVAQSRTVVDDVNERFIHGHATDDLTASGVILHHFSPAHAVELGEPWRPYTPEECAAHHYSGCDTTGDRACTLISNNQTRDEKDGSIPVYSTSVGGIIFNPQKSTVMCAYSQDGGTDDRSNRGCGCHQGDTACEQRQTNNSCVLDVKAGVEDYGVCWWGPDDLKQMFEHQEGVYNEVVLDTTPWLDNLPDSIEAFFYVKGADKLNDTIDAYHTFLQSYPDACVPLLEMDIHATDSPFSYSKQVTDGKTDCKSTIDYTDDNSGDDESDSASDPSSAHGIGSVLPLTLAITLLSTLLA